MTALRSDSPIQYVKGVGPARADQFAALGIGTVTDLLEYLPFRHEYDQGGVDIVDLQPGAPATVRGEVIHVQHPGRRGGQLIVTIHDGTAECVLRWFNAPSYDLKLRRGAIVQASGPVRDYGGRAEMVQPRIRLFAPDEPPDAPPPGARLIGIYPASEQLPTFVIRRTVEQVLRQPGLIVEEFLPPELRQRRQLPTREAALRAMHQPQDEAAVVQARARLAYEEFLLLELALAQRRRKTHTLQTTTKLHVDDHMDQRIRARFPFALTPAQDAVVAELRRDLASGHPMTRLLQGDVGCGKTVVALYGCLAAIAHRRQAAIMAPTEVLAEQHFANVEKYLAGSRVRRVRLTGSLSPLERQTAQRAIEAGEVDLVIGTQALIQEAVAFRDLALIVVDEQHKFGVLQRAAFRTKGAAPHLLVMTATPIPRTLAMTVFGDLDVSIIRAAPPGRGQVKTQVLAPTRLEAVLAEVRTRLEAGEQAYVVCPLVGDAGGAGREQGPGNGEQGGGYSDEATKRRSDAGENEHREPGTGNTEQGLQKTAGGGATIQNRKFTIQNRDAKPQVQNRTATRGPHKSAICNPQSAIAPPAPPRISARIAFERLKAGAWAGLALGLLHGSMKPTEKHATVEAFRAGQIQALVATTVVEVGVDVPNATIMLILDADQFGLSQLHQLRGRIGRGGKDGLCLLVAAGRGLKARERLAIMAQTTDGFRIAEADLQQRGPGELLGTRQHGLPELKVGDLVADFAILEQARQDAFELVARDAELTHVDHAALKTRLRRTSQGRLKLVDAG